MVSSSIITISIIIVALLFIYHMHLNQTVYMFDKREAFQNLTKGLGYPAKQLCTMPLTSPLPELSGPANTTISEPRDPYHLLGDYMPPGEERLSSLISESAYMADGQRHIEMTGSYGQVTNNYKRKNPDNGSTLLHELALSFYKS